MPAIRANLAPLEGRPQSAAPRPRQYGGLRDLCQAPDPGAARGRRRSRAGGVRLTRGSAVASRRALDAERFGHRAAGPGHEPGAPRAGGADAAPAGRAARRRRHPAQPLHHRAGAAPRAPGHHDPRPDLQALSGGARRAALARNERSRSSRGEALEPHHRRFEGDQERRGRAPRRGSGQDRRDLRGPGFRTVRRSGARGRPPEQVLARRRPDRPQRLRPPPAQEHRASDRRNGANRGAGDPGDPGVRDPLGGGPQGTRPAGRGLRARPIPGLDFRWRARGPL